MNICVTEDKVDDVLNSCSEATDSGVSNFPGMSYEQGVEYAINWLLNDGDHPINE